MRCDACDVPQKLGLDKLLASQQAAQQGGVRTTSRRGALCYDLQALSLELQKR